MTESDYKAKIVKILKNKGFFVYVTKDNVHRGIPDLITLSPAGKMIAIELKLLTKSNPHPKLSALQELNLIKIAKNNGIGIILTINETDKDMESILEITNNLYSYCINAKNINKPKFVNCITKMGR